jgi:hypothetical protein
VVFGVSTRKITVTLPDEQLDGIRDLAAAGQGGKRFRFRQARPWTRLFTMRQGGRRLLEDALRKTGGPLIN